MTDTSSSHDAPPPPADDPNLPPPYLAICPPAPPLQPPPLESVTDGTVTIRRWLPSDADALFRIISASRPRLAAWMPWARADRGGPSHERREAVSSFTERTALRWEAGSGWDYAIVTVTEEEGEEVIVGSCGLRRREGGGVEAGYWLADGHTGRGLATRAVGLLTEQAWRMGAPSVRVVHDEANARSAGVPRRLGFECEGEVEAEDNPEGRRDTVWVKYRGPC